MGRIDYKTAPECDVIINKIIERKRKGLYSLVLLVGLPGSGKTYSSIRLAEILCEIQGKPKFKVDRIVDSLPSFVKQLKDIKEPGEPIVLEEVSTLYPSRRAMSKDNLDVSKILDTCRKKQVILLANSPIFKTIDSHFRAMSNFLIETSRINRKEGVVISKAWFLQTAPKSGITYTHTMTRDGYDVGIYITRKPDKELLKEYELKKDQFMDKLYERIHIESTERENKHLKKKPLGAVRVNMLSPQEVQVHHLFFNKGYKQVDIAKELSISGARISNIIQNIKKKTEMPRENQQIKVDKPSNPL